MQQRFWALSEKILENKNLPKTEDPISEVLDEPIVEVKKTLEKESIEIQDEVKLDNLKEDQLEDDVSMNFQY